MTAELARGQNHPLTQVRLEIRISAGTPVVAAVTIGDAHGTVHGAEQVAHPGAPALPGLEVPQRAAAVHRLAVDLGAMPQAAHRLSVLLALPTGGGAPLRFGAVAAPFVAVTDLDGTEIATFTLTGLDTESAVVALELYRRQGAWKVRAIGQGYAGGLAELLTDQGLSDAHRLANAVHEAVTQGLAHSVATSPQRTPDGDRTRPTAHPGPDRQTPAPPQPTSPYGAHGDGPEHPAEPQPSTPPPGSPVDYTHPGRRTTPPAPTPTAPPVPVAGDASGWSMDERLYHQIRGMFEDLARTTAAYRGAVDFAEARRDRELDQVLSDPRARIGGQGDAARAAARAKHADLVGQARAVLDRDLAQLAAESDVVEPALPPAYARWDNPVWHGYRVPMEMPMAMRLGDLSLPESDRLRIPMLVRLPLEHGLWIDSGRTGPADTSFADGHRRGHLALDLAVAIAARLLAIHPAHAYAVHVIDPAGNGTQALAPLVRTGVLAAPPARGAAGVADTLTRLTRRVDLVQMAVRGGAADALPPDVDTAEQLLIVNDFPHGFDDRAVTRLRYLADEGPAVGVHLLTVADREAAAEYGPLLDPLWRSLMRLTPVPDDHLVDPWVGHAWTYEPPLVPPGGTVLQQVLDQVTAARTKY
ncbi:TerD family protein [Streptomyces sp. NPDC087425]|uniref:TerD family protein n=1 Tax=Streptomyces sp. NPDC087425 TaxID=3365787 RepID=UPI00382D249A